jgi:hypothetical protein
MKLFIASTWRSADVTKSSIAAEEIPCASGVLRGKEPELFAAVRPTAARERNSDMAIDFLHWLPKRNPGAHGAAMLGPRVVGIVAG